MKTISFIIPVYNEEERLSITFEALKKLRVPRGLKLEKVYEGLKIIIEELQKI